MCIRDRVYTDNFYGTLKSEIERIWAAGKSVVFDVDVIGGLNLKKQFGDQALSVFVQPPSIEELEVRLRSRSTESEDRIQVRMGKAREELAHAEGFDVVLLNVHLDKACEEAEAIVAKFLNA
jgi:guanylate kinase